MRVESWDEIKLYICLVQKKYNCKQCGSKRFLHQQKEKHKMAFHLRQLIKQVDAYPTLSLSLDRTFPPHGWARPVGPKFRRLEGTSMATENTIQHNRQGVTILFSKPTFQHLIVTHRWYIVLQGKSILGVVAFELTHLTTASSLMITTHLVYSIL